MENQEQNQETSKLRLDEQIPIWRKEVFKRDQFICVVCLHKGKELNAHHLDGYNWCKDYRYVIENGVTLCTKCHDKFHKQFGFGGNTKEQFWEFRKANSNEDFLF